jgi:hypothetical protein
MCKGSGMSPVRDPGAFLSEIVFFFVSLAPIVDLEQADEAGQGRAMVMRPGRVGWRSQQESSPPLALC